MTDDDLLLFNPPPGWPRPPHGWRPPKGWKPDPSWPEPPPGWPLWIANAAVKSVLRGSVPTSTIEDPDADARSGSDQRVALLVAENAALKARLESMGADPAKAVVLDDEKVLQDVGIYRYHHPLENAVAYQARLDDVSARVANMVKTGTAIQRSNMFTFDGSLAQGRVFTRDLAKLMLRAYNAEAENVIRTLRPGNSAAAINRLAVAKAAIANLGKMMEMHISDQFHALRTEEIELTADYLMKKEEEREAAREERERLREERKVEAELAAARERLEKERQHLVTVLGKVQATGGADTELQQKIGEIDAAIAQNDYRAANIRAGYVYVISNRGAFGRHVVKIGLTRRLDPLERISELGDASVPFRFDVHTLFFSEDAVALENQLHESFTDRRMNWANSRKEFFFASPAEVRTVLAEKLGKLLEFSENAESAEYLQSIRYWPKEFSPSEGH